MKTRRTGMISTALLAAFLSVLLAAGQKGDQAELALKAAMNKELVDGDLRGAIEQYQRIIKTFPDKREVGAKALLQIGVCYEKLGKEEAQKAYQQVIKDYADQPTVVANAKARLASLTSAQKPVDTRKTTPERPATSVGSREMNIRRIYDGTGLEWGNALSSDGRHLVYTDWETGDMAVVDLTTREHRRLTNTGGLKKPSSDMGETSVFSPDDRRIAYGWMIGSKLAELRVVNFDGTDPQLLLRDETAVWIRPHDWSGDGKNILIAVMRKDNSTDVGLFSLGEKKVSVIRHVLAKDPEMRLSPDGRMIAYSMPQEPESSKRDIFVMRADGTAHEPVVAHPADDYLLGWAPDGRRLIFASDRTGTFGIWGVGIKEGRMDGTPQRIKGDVTPSPVRLTPDGTLYFILTERLADVCTVSIDPDTGKMSGQPASLKAGPGSRYSPDWSPDGSRLAYKFYVGTELQPAGPALISIFDLKSGEEQKIETGLNSATAIDGPRWAPDGRSVLLIGGRGEGMGIYRIEIPGGVQTLLVRIPPSQYCFRAAWAPDGKSIFYHVFNPLRIFRHDIDANRDIELVKTSMNGFSQLALSPDGKWLAFTSREASGSPLRVSLVSAAGGPIREVFTMKPGEIVQWLEWRPDSRSIWLRKYIPPADAKMKPTFEFLSISPDGQNTRKLDQSLIATGVNRFHPDGRRLAFSIGQSRVELWALENFLQPIPK